MQSSSNKMRTYLRQDSIVFCKTKERFGGLSNMAAGFPIRINNIDIMTSEALYQACRFPHLPEVQQVIIEQRSPMTAKMKSKAHRKNSRPDWDYVCVKIMRWCLQVKLAQNWDVFSDLLLSTGEYSIVEESHKDDFWGAKVSDNDILIGRNLLGRLLMELRTEIKFSDKKLLNKVEPLLISNFFLFNQPISTVEKETYLFVKPPYEYMPNLNPTEKQLSLFS